MKKYTYRNIPLVSLLVAIIFLLLMVSPVLAVDDPSGLQANPRSSTEVSLLWVRGADSTNTTIQMTTGDSYPANMTDGTRVYRDTGSSFLVEDLTAGTTYRFRAWGETAGVNSTGYSSDMATTSASIPDETLYPDPDEPGGDMFNPPSEGGMSGNPLFDIINYAADNSNIPRETMWLLLALGAMMGGAYIGFKWMGFTGFVFGMLAGPFVICAVGIWSWWVFAFLLGAILPILYLKGRTV